MSEIGKGPEVVRTETHASASPAKLVARIFEQDVEFVSATTDDAGHEIEKNHHVHWGDKAHPHGGTVTKADRADGMIEIHGDDGVDYVIHHSEIHDDTADEKDHAHK